MNTGYFLIPVRGNKNPVAGRFHLRSSVKRRHAPPCLCLLNTVVEVIAPYLSPGRRNEELRRDEIFKNTPLYRIKQFGIMRADVDLKVGVVVMRGKPSALSDGE